MTTKRFLLILAWLSVSLPALTQNLSHIEVDSLRREYAKGRLDSVQVLIMIDLAEGQRGEHPDSTLYYAQRAVTLAQELNYAQGELRAHLALSGFFRSYGNFPKALEEGLKGLEVAQAKKLKTDQAYAMIRIGNIYFDMKDNKAALDYFLKGNKVVDDNLHPFFYAVTFFRAADAYERMDMLDSALYMADIAYLKGTKLDDPIITGAALRTMGNAYGKKGNSHLALEYFHRCLEVFLSKGMYSNVADTYVDLATFHQQRNNVDSAIFYAKKANELAEPRLQRDAVMKSAELLSALYEKTHPVEALRYLKLANAMRDSLYSLEKVLAVHTLSFEERERQNELEQAKAAYRNQVRQYVLTGGIGFLLLLLLVMYRNNRLKQKTNKLLENQKSKIESTLTELKSTQSQLIQSEKMASLGELTAGIAHEIQNPLNFVNNFSEINKELIAEMESAVQKKSFDEVLDIAKSISVNQEKINHHGKRADAIVKSMLQHSRTSSGQKELTDINKLCEEYLRLAYHGYRAKDKTFNAEINSDLDRSIPRVNIVPQDMGRVILNLLNNALYAVHQKTKQSPGTYQPSVTIATKTSSNKVEISVRDNGNGIVAAVKEKIFQPFFTTKPTGEGTGLGLSLAYDIITKAHGGELRVETIEGEGSTFAIVLPIR